MGALLAARRRQIRGKGRAMVLRRQLAGSPPSVAEFTVQGFDRAFQPQQLIGEVQQGDMLVEILVDEIAAAGWPGPPRNLDTLTIDGKTWSIRGANPVHEGAALIGHTLWVRGNQ